MRFFMAMFVEILNINAIAIAGKRTIAAFEVQRPNDNLGSIATIRLFQKQPFTIGANRIGMGKPFTVNLVPSRCYRSTTAIHCE